ncbi:MAG: LysR family transcriptional regulator [Mesorhizobium sp.]|nr:MAG: LysR family transcriptional regulator [Mesorhizobium sp.]
MPRDEFSEMRAFLEVARERSFTRAAAKLGVTRSALSHTIRAMEERLGVRLLSRTTRDVAPTAAGERLVESDAGVRLGEAIARDMVAVRIGPDVGYAVVGSSDYFARRDAPKSPQDLTDHNCINLRLPSSGALYAWEFRKNGREFSVRVDGQLTLNNIAPALDAALDGIGLAYAPTELVQPYVVSGRLEEVLADWCPTFQGYHLYYPSRRNQSPAFAAFVAAFRYQSR